MSAIAEKIKKLIAMEQSSRKIGNQNEAEAFASKVSALLAEHKLSMSDVEEKAQETEDPFGVERVTRKGATYTPSWRITIASAIARSCFCQIFYHQGYSCITFVGRASDRSSAIALYIYLTDLAKRLATKEFKKYKAANKEVYGYELFPGQTQISWKNGFTAGFAAGINSRLRQETQILETGPQCGLILRQTALLKQYVESTLGLGGEGRSRSSSYDGGAYQSGKEHGATVPMGSRRLQLGVGQ